MKEFPRFDWGKDAKVKTFEPGTSFVILLINPALIRTIAYEYSKYNGPLPVRRTRADQHNPNGRYELMWIRYPYEIPAEIVGGVCAHKSILRSGGQDPRERLFIDPEVATAMIRDGTLAMLAPKEFYQQDLHWTDDVHYIKNYKGSELYFP